MDATIFVLDENVDVRNRLNHLLKRQGFQVWDFEQGDALFQAMKVRPPDLILLGVQNGHANGTAAVDGMDICRRLKLDPVTSFIPILVYAVPGDSGRILAARRLGADDFIPAPSDGEVLMSKIGRFLSLSGKESAS